MIACPNLLCSLMIVTKAALSLAEMMLSMVLPPLIRTPPVLRLGGRHPMLPVCPHKGRAVVSSPGLYTERVWGMQRHGRKEGRPNHMINDLHYISTDIVRQVSDTDDPRTHQMRTAPTGTRGLLQCAP